MGSPFLPLFQLCNFPPPAPFSKGEFGGRAIYVTWFVRMQRQKRWRDRKAAAPPQLALSPTQKAPTPEGPPKKLQMRAHLPFNGHNLRRTREAAREKQILQVLALFL